MANNEFKKIGKPGADTSKGESFVDVMKPFVKFGNWGDERYCKYTNLYCKKCTQAQSKVYQKR